MKVEYARAVEAARRLEENNIICNYQAAPDEEGFTAAGALRLGVQEMTRFGMGPEDFRTLAQYIHDVVVDRPVRPGGGDGLQEALPHDALLLCGRCVR